MFKILKVIFLGIKDIIRIKKQIIKNIQLMNVLKYVNPVMNLNQELDNVEYVGVLWILKQK